MADIVSIGLQILEYTWLIGGLVGIYLASSHFRKAKRDMRVQLRYGEDGVMKVQAQGNVDRERDRLVFQISIFCLGIIAFLTPQPVRERLTLQSLIFSLTAQFFQWFSINGSYRDYRIRKIVEHGDKGVQNHDD